MKKLIAVLLFFSAVSFAQQVAPGNLIELKQQAFQIENSGVQSFSFSAERTKKNTGLAILFSLLLPGMGELYAGGFESGKYFTIADGVLWGVFAGFNIYGNWKENNYKSFAESNAGVKLEGKDEEFFANLGLYGSMEEYNRAQGLKRQFANLYNSQNYNWEWKSDAQRKQYREMWSSSEQAFNNLRFAAGALILNRLISAVNAVRLVSSYNKNIEAENPVGIYFDYRNRFGFEPELSLHITKGF